MTFEGAIREQHARALRTAYSLARAQRRAELDGGRYRAYDSRGLHSYSVEWGVVEVCEALMPDLAHVRRAREDDDPLDPVSMRVRAGKEAESEYIADVLKRTVAK